VPAGKSTIARGIVRAYCRDAHLDVPSPTFLLCLSYEVNRRSLTVGPTIWTDMPSPIIRLNVPSLLLPPLTRTHTTTTFLLCLSFEVDGRTCTTKFLPGFA
jgi:hypothetical protein